MARADPGRIYLAKATLGLERNPKEFCMGDQYQVYPIIIIVFGHFSRAPGRISFIFSNVQVRNIKDSLFFCNFF